VLIELFVWLAVAGWQFLLVYFAFSPLDPNSFLGSLLSVSSIPPTSSFSYGLALGGLVFCFVFFLLLAGLSRRAIFSDACAIVAFVAFLTRLSLDEAVAKESAFEPPLPLLARALPALPESLHPLDVALRRLLSVDRLAAFALSYLAVVSLPWLLYSTPDDDIHGRRNPYRPSNDGPPAWLQRSVAILGRLLSLQLLLSLAGALPPPQLPARLFQAALTMGAYLIAIYRRNEER